MRRLFFAACLLLILCSCSPYKEQSMPPVQRTEYLGDQRQQVQQLQQLQLPIEIQITSSKAIVRRGEIASVEAQGMPNTMYTITASYNISGKTMTTHASKRSDDTGRVSWSWKVSEDTDVGTYPVTVSGGGQSATFLYTVRE